MDPSPRPDHGSRRVPGTGAAPAPAPVTVSVVIPVKDDAEMLRRCLRALALQTRPPDEIVVVDNGSTDDSAQVAIAAGARVVVCRERGIPAASARGYDAAVGQLVMRLDADCLPAATWVSALVDTFARRPDVDVLTGLARFREPQRLVAAALSAAYLGSYALVGMASLGHLPLFGSNLAFRRSAWQEVRAEVHRDDPEVHDDLDLAFHLGERHRIRFAPDAAMGMSVRALQPGNGFRRRVRRGARTVLLHWPRDFPPVRWNRLMLRRVLTAAGRPPRRRT
jgi:glycosyltransferase involved in cell wall biosynthesis